MPADERTSKAAQLSAEERADLRWALLHVQNSIEKNGGSAESQRAFDESCIATLRSLIGEGGHR